VSRILAAGGFQIAVFKPKKCRSLVRRLCPIR